MSYAIQWALCWELNLRLHAFEVCILYHQETHVPTGNQFPYAHNFIPRFLPINWLSYDLQRYVFIDKEENGTKATYKYKNTEETLPLLCEVNYSSA